MLSERVLGWCEAGALPEGITAHPLPDLRLLTTTLLDRPDPSAHAILALQQACFDRGLDLLPIDPTLDCSVAQALGLPPKMLLDRLKALRGMAQMTLCLDWPLPPQASTDGRGWLAGRRAQMALQDGARAWLDRLAQRLALPASPAQSRMGCAILHLLAPRQALPDLETLAALTRDTTDPAPDCRLTLTGPWPPHAFSRLSERQAA